MRMPRDSRTARPSDGGRGVLEALVEQRSVELGQLEPEAAERLAELLPLALPEVARERPEAWPRRPTVEAREHVPGEAQIARDERRRSRRRLEREPPVVSDLGERARAFREVDPARSRTAVARHHARVLDVNSPDQRAEGPDLRRDDRGRASQAGSRGRSSTRKPPSPRERRARGSPAAESVPS